LQDSDADDVAQEVLLLLSKQMRRFQYDPSKRFRCWLKAVVHSTWCDWAARRRDWQIGSVDPRVLEQLETAAAGEDLLDRIVAQYDRELLETASRRARERVEPHTWEAYRLLAYDGLSGQEVADRLGIRLNRAYSARFKVQQLIREEFERLDPAD
jgi:RNA polymerase sigma-70 factor (ECF subfamily)